MSDIRDQFARDLPTRSPSAAALDSAAALFDEVVYPSIPFSQTHPDRLAVLASLYGLSPAPVERCRILELGAGDGSNLIPMALGLPQATLVGVDIAAAPIARGQRTIEALGLTNIQLRCADLLELTHEAESPSAEPFDYIVAHGVYSWVPPEVREAILTIMGRLLAPHGVAYLSYNAFPGGHLRQSVRETLLFHTGGAGTSAGNGALMVERAQGLARLLADATPAAEETVSIRAALRTAANRHPAALFHDELAPINQAFYFHEVVEQAAHHGLQYLAEAEFMEMQDHAFSPKVRGILATIEQEQGRIAREQYLDLLKFRQFRQTLLCRADAPLAGPPTADDMRRFLVASPMQAISEAPDLRVGVAEQFRGPRRATVQIDLPLAKAAFLELSEAWPERLSFEELAGRAEARLAPLMLPGSPAEDRAALAEILFDSYRAALLQAYGWKPTLAPRATVRPVVSPLARLQASDAEAPAISTLLHDCIEIGDAATRHMLRLLDGTLDRTALLASLRALSERPLDEALTPESIEANLRWLAQLGLLIA